MKNVSGRHDYCIGYNTNKKGATVVRNSIFRVGRYLAVMTTLLALIGMSASVQATSFRRGWDPLFNTAFPDLGWRGEAVIFVSDSCVSAGTTVSFDTSGVNTSCGGSANLESYLLEFYDVNNPLVNLFSASDSTPGSPLFPAVSAVSFGIGSIADGVSLHNEIQVTGSFSFDSHPNTVFTAFLDFDINATTGLDSTSLRLQEICEKCNPDIFYSTVNPTVAWSQVPVPAPLALVGIGLFALAMTRRRRA